jgi:hypothetical protein
MAVVIATQSGLWPFALREHADTVDGPLLQCSPPYVAGLSGPCSDGEPSP